MRLICSSVFASMPQAHNSSRVLGRSARLAQRQAYVQVGEAFDVLPVGRREHKTLGQRSPGRIADDPAKLLLPGGDSE